MVHTSDARSVLVTGANGFTGSHLAHGLSERGYRVRGMVRPGADVSALEGAEIELSVGELTNRHDVARAARGVGTIYHIAAAFRVAGKPDSYFHDINVGGTENVLDAMASEGVDTLVHCSTIGVHGDVTTIPCTEESAIRPGDSYQRTKWEGERRVHAAIRSGMDAVVIRPAGIYGPGDLRFLKLFRTVDNGTFRMIGSGEVLFHMVYIDDLVDAFILAGENPGSRGRAYVIAGPGYVSLNELVRLVAEGLGVPPPRGRLPVAPFLALAGACELACRPFGIEPPLHRRRVHFFTKNRAFDIGRARRDLGYDPQVTTREGVSRTIRWLIEEGHLPARPANAPAAVPGREGETPSRLAP
jgi:dihydroflavonol-4-reductase